MEGKKEARIVSSDGKDGWTGRLIFLKILLMNSTSADVSSEGVSHEGCGITSRWCCMCSAVISRRTTAAKNMTTDEATLEQYLDDCELLLPVSSRWQKHYFPLIRFGTSHTRKGHCTTILCRL